MLSAIFLDRDGIINVTNIINRKPVAIYNASQLVFVDGIVELVRYFCDLGFLIFCITNQPDISRGKLSEKNVLEINEKIMKELPIKKIYVCPHDDADKCECRKPKTGMLMEAKREYYIDMKSSWVIGDRWSDIECGKSAGCKTIFVDYGYSENLLSIPDITVKNIKEICYDKNFC